MPKIIKKEANVFYGTLVVKVDGEYIQLGFEQNKDGDDVIIVGEESNVQLTTREALDALIAQQKDEGGDSDVDKAD